MKNRVLIPIACFAVFGFFAFQPPTLHPEIAAAKVWYEANITSVLTPNWATAELDIYPNGNVTVSLPVSNFSTYKWRDSNHPDTSQVNGTTRILIGKRPNKPYETYFLRFDFFPSSLTAQGLQNIRLKPTLLNSMSFNGICYAQSMIDSAMHGGMLFENGVPTKSVYRRPGQDVDVVSDRGCIEIWVSYQTGGSIPSNNPWVSGGTNTTGSVYISWTSTLVEVVCNNAAPWTGWGNTLVGLGTNWQYPWGLADPWSTYPGGNTWNPPPTPPTPVSTDESQCTCFMHYFDNYYDHFNPALPWPYSNYWYNVNKTVLGCNCKTGTFTDGAFLIYPAPGQSGGAYGISSSVTMNYCEQVGEIYYVAPCKRKVTIVHDGTMSWSLTFMGILESSWNVHRHTFPETYLFE